MYLGIPDDIVVAAHLDETALRLELAIALYARKNLSFGQARRLSGVNWFNLRSILHERQIPIHYEMEDLQTDLTNIEHFHNQ